MSELIKIYENVVRHKKEVVHMEEQITEEVIRLSEPFKDKLNANELETLQDAMFSVALTSQHEGFKLGMKYFAKLLAEFCS